MNQSLCEHGEASEIDWAGAGRKAGGAESTDSGKDRRESIKRQEKTGRNCICDGVFPGAMIRS